MQTSYHVHSRWSDGQSDIPALIAAAREVGLAEIGISDHYVFAPDGKAVSWSMPLDGLSAYIADIDASAAEAGPGVRRAMMFGAEQVILQHRAMWDLLQARAEARAD